ncbi:hypothetical protein D3C75_880420 [compost metagenome]
MSAPMRRVSRNACSTPLLAISPSTPNCAMPLRKSVLESVRSSSSLKASSAANTNGASTVPAAPASASCMPSVHARVVRATLACSASSGGRSAVALPRRASRMSLAIIDSMLIWKVLYWNTSLPTGFCCSFPLLYWA